MVVLQGVGEVVMKKSGRRFLALLLSALMTVQFAPTVTVRADEVNTGTEYVTGNITLGGWQQKLLMTPLLP